MNRIFFALVLAICSMLPSYALSASCPAGRVLTLLVPWPAGRGPIDLAARIIQEPLEREVGRTVIVKNMPGADGILGTSAFVKANDPCQLLIGTASGNIINPLVKKIPPYDPLADFSPIAMIGEQPIMLVVNSEVPVGTFRELLTYVRSNPGKLNCASGYMTGRLLCELFPRWAGPTVTVPYLGQPQAVAGLLGGQTHFMFATTGLVAGHVKAGKLRALAIFGQRRSVLLPDVLPLSSEELKALGFERSSRITSWIAVFGSKNIDSEEAEKLSEAVNKVLKLVIIRDRFQKMDLEVIGGGRKELTSHLKVELELWRAIIRDSGVAEN